MANSIGFSNEDMQNPHLHHHINNQMSGTPLPDGAQPLSNTVNPPGYSSPDVGHAGVPNEGGHVGAHVNRRRPNPNAKETGSGVVRDVGKVYTMLDPVGRTALNAATPAKYDAGEERARATQARLDKSNSEFETGQVLAGNVGPFDAEAGRRYENSNK